MILGEKFHLLQALSVVSIDQEMMFGHVFDPNPWTYLLPLTFYLEDEILNKTVTHPISLSFIYFISRKIKKREI